MTFLDMAEKILGELQTESRPIKDRILCGHRVNQVVWETSNAVIFKDDFGHFWRYLDTYKQCWPVIIGKNND